jgi:hypothetical protein
MDPVAPEFIRKGVQIGIDIGQRVDPTAIVVAERQLQGFSWPSLDFRSPDDNPVGGDIHYTIRFVERMPLNTPYPKVADRLAEVYNGLVVAGRPTEAPHPLLRERYAKHSTGRHIHAVLVDATGVGTPVVDLLREKNIQPLTPVYLTGGEKATHDNGELRLAKGLLVSRLQVLLQQRRIHLPDTAEARALTEELLNYEIRMTESANLQTGVFKTGKHDDLATALGLACWDDDQRGTFGIFYSAELAELFGGFGASDAYYRS